MLFPGCLVVSDFIIHDLTFDLLMTFFKYRNEICSNADTCEGGESSFL